MLHRLAGADDLDQRPLELFGDLRANNDNRAAAVADDAAIEPMQRGSDHRRVHHVLDGHYLGQHGVRIVLRVMRGGDFDPGELLARGAVLVHVAHRAHGVGVDGSDGVGRFPAASGWFGSRGRGAVPVAMPSLRGLPASVTSATSHLPAAIASAACDASTI